MKTLVVVMGVMLVVGTLALIVAIFMRTGKPPGVETGAAPAGQPFSAAPIELPRGARIESMAAGPSRLVLDIVMADGNRRLIVIDLATGRQTGTIPLHVAP